MNTITCTACHEPVRRGEAVIRTRTFKQVGWHAECWTIHRAVSDVVAAEIVAEEVGGTLSERMARAGRK